MAEITQHLGFEAGQAIAALKELDLAIGGVNRRLATFNKRTGASAANQAVTQSFQQLAQQAQQTQQAVQQAGNAMRQTGQQGTAAAKSVTVSWETMIRVVATQVMVRALNNLIQGFSDTADAAEDFQIQVARIANIADGPAGSINNLTNSLNGLSEDLGRSIGEVGEAAFEGLQNDLGTTAETLDLLKGSANDLALVTGGTLTESVNAISSVLKAYNLDISEAGQVTDIFFGAIDAGRITLDDLQSSLGTVLPLSSLLGISFKETAGSIAAITQNGTTAATAQTQLRNVLSKLQKPTEALAGAFQELGVASGRELIAKFGGLIPALQALEEVAAGDEEAMAKFFGTIRGNLGALNLLSNDAKIVTNILDDLGNSAGRAAEAADAIDQTDARQSQKAFAQLDRTMRELGETTQQLRTSFIQTFNAIIPSAEAAKNVIAGVGGALAGLGAVGVASSVVALTAAFGPLAVAIGAVAVAAAGLGVIFGDTIRSVESALDAIDRVESEAGEKSREESKERLEQTNKDFRESLAEREQFITDYLDTIDKSFERETKAITQANDLAGRALDAAVDRFGKGLDSVFNRINQQMDDLEQRVAEAEDAARTAGQNLADFKFDRSIEDLPIGQQIEASLRRAKAEAAALQTAIAQAGNDPAALDGLDEFAKRLIENGRRAENLVKSSKDAADATFADDAINLQEQGLSALDTIARKRLENLKEQQTVDRNEVDTQEAITKKIQENLELQSELAKNTDANGNLQTDEQQAADKERIEALKGELKGLTDQLNRDLFDKFGETDNIKKLITGLEEAFRTANLEFANVRSNLQAVLDQGPFKAAVQLSTQMTADTGNKTIDDARDAAREGAGVNPADQIKAVRDADITLAKELEGLREDRKVAADAFNASQQSQNSIFETIGKRLEDGEVGFVTTIADRTRDLNSALSDINVSPEALKGIEGQFLSMKGRISEAFKTGLISEDTSIGLLSAVDKALESVNLRENVIQLDAQFDPAALDLLKTQLLDLPNQINTNGIQIPVEGVGIEQLMTDTTALKQNFDTTALSAGNVATNTANIGTAAGGAATAVGGIATTMGGVTSATGQAIAAMNALAAAAARALAAARAAQAASAGGSAKQYGGRVGYRAQGGVTRRGVDTQLMVTEPGEMIINSRQSNNFRPQLEAMNAGQSPSARDRGGSTTTIGDVNVNIYPNSINDVDGDRLGRSLRRQLRRETLDL